MDEPCSALDPISTLAIEDLIAELKDNYTIVIVTHNMQQAARVSDPTAFFNITGPGEPGRLVEVGPHREDLHQARRPPHRGLHHREVRLMAEDLRVGFHRDLEEIDQKVVQLFALVSEGLSAATDAFLAGDREAAKRLMERDKVIDSLYIDVEEIVYRQLATQSPMAKDLRFLLSVLRIVPELERSGDLAEHIAQRAARAWRRPSPRGSAASSSRWGWSAPRCGGGRPRFAAGPGGAPNQKATTSSTSCT